MVHAPASCGRGLDWRTIDPRSDAPSSKKTRKLVGDRFKRFSMAYTYRKMSLNYATLLHVLSPSSLPFNSSRLDRRLDNDLITSARRADVSLLARPTHACTCYYKFPGNQGRGQPVWSWAAATAVRSAILATAWLLVHLTACTLMSFSASLSCRLCSSHAQLWNNVASIVYTPWVDDRTVDLCRAQLRLNCSQWQWRI